MRVLVATIFLTFISNNLFAQSAWKSFWKLSSFEKSWVITHPCIAEKVFQITNTARKEALKMESDSTLDRDPQGGQVDAFRHAYWMALLSQHMCWKKAIKLGAAHERGNYRQFKRSKSEGGEIPDSISSVMDIFNNHTGAIIGCNNKSLSEDDLKQKITNAILHGNMRIIAKNGNGLPIDNHGNVIEIKGKKNTWNIPKYLIPSDLQHKK